MYDRLATENRVPYQTDKINYCGGTLHAPFGEFFTDAGWFRMKPNKGGKKADWWDASLGYKNDRLRARAGYKTVEDGFNGLSCADKFFFTVATNYKGWFAEGDYKLSDTFTINGQFKRYKAAGASSDEPGEREGADNAFDGDISTIWHTRWKKNAPGYPHYVIGDYGKTLELKGVIAIPRQEMTNGRVCRYRIELSDDAKTWRKVAEGKLPNTSDLTEIKFGKTEAARYIRFTALSPWDKSHPWASMAELQPLLRKK